jgi:hypothetical protein
MDFINRLREKKPSTKKYISFIASGVVTLSIFAVWASVFHFGAGVPSSQNTAAVVKSSEVDVNPFNAFWNVIVGGIDDLNKNIVDIREGEKGAQNFVEALGKPKETSPANDATIISVDTPEVEESQDSNTNKNTQNDVFILDTTTQ